MIQTVHKGFKCDPSFKGERVAPFTSLRFSFELGKGWDFLLSYLTVERLDEGFSADVSTHKIFGVTNQNILIDWLRIPDSIRLGIRPHKDVKTQRWGWIPVCYVHSGGVRYYPRMNGDLVVGKEYVCEIQKIDKGYGISLKERVDFAQISYLGFVNNPPKLDSTCRTSGVWIEPLAYAYKGKTGVPFDVQTLITVL